MKFDISYFILETEVKTIELDEEYLKPSVLSYSKAKIEKYEWVKKTKDITVFRSLSLRSKNGVHIVIDNLFDMIDLIEIFKAFNANKLDSSKTYQIGNMNRDAFSARLEPNDENKINLSILFSNFKTKIILDKFDCASLSAKFSKIIQKCEAFQD